MTQEEYIQKRVDDQVRWYSKKSKINRNYALWSKVAIIVFAALIPFASGFLDDGLFWLKYIIAALGALTAIIAGIADLYKFQEKWNSYRNTAEELKQEKYFFETSTGPYAAEENGFKKFVVSVENFISQENTNWRRFVNQAEGQE